MPRALIPACAWRPALIRFEAEARALVGQALTRGTCYATLSVQREAVVPEVRINQDLLNLLAKALASVLLAGGLQPASLDGAPRRARCRGGPRQDRRRSGIGASARRCFGQPRRRALAALVTMRRSEGQALGQIYRPGSIDDGVAAGGRRMSCPRARSYPGQARRNSGPLGRREISTRIGFIRRRC